MMLFWNRFLDKMGKTGSRLQFVNGIALLGSFFCVRLVWGGKMVSLKLPRWFWVAERCTVVRLFRYIKRCLHRTSSGLHHGLWREQPDAPGSQLVLVCVDDDW